MLAKNNTPGYMLFGECIRVRLCYATQYSKRINYVTNSHYIDSKVLVNFCDYRNMINRYDCNDEMFTLCGDVHSVSVIFMKCKMPEHVIDIIKNYTYFDYDIKTWNINKLLVHNIVSLSDLNEIFPKTINYLYDLIYRYSGIFSTNDDYIINVSDMTVENCNKLFNLINIDV